MSGIVYCCPTRGKPEYLDDFLSETIDRSRLPDTRFVVGIDDDEVGLYANSRLRDHKQVIWSIKPREDSLGAKFNRCAAAAPDADWYIMGVDDLAIQTITWDVYVSELGEHYPDGLGVVNFGRQWNEPALPAFQMSSKKFIEMNGFFMAPYFPFWWHDTWNLEMAQFTGRDCYLDIEVRYPQKEPMTPRRDISFWALFFDLTRTLRIEKAKEILKASDSPPYLKYKLFSTMGQMAEMAENRNARCRDPLWGMKFQAERVTDTLDERHQRLLEGAKKMLDELQGMQVKSMEEEQKGLSAAA